MFRRFFIVCVDGNGDWETEEHYSTSNHRHIGGHLCLEDVMNVGDIAFPIASTEEIVAVERTKYI